MDKDSNSPKLPYSKPKLVVYGSLRELTQATSSMNPKSDNLNRLSKT